MSEADASDVDVWSYEIEGRKEYVAAVLCFLLPAFLTIAGMYLLFSGPVGGWMPHPQFYLGVAAALLAFLVSRRAMEWYARNYLIADVDGLIRRKDILTLLGVPFGVAGFAMHHWVHPMGWIAVFVPFVALLYYLTEYRGWP